MTVQKWCKVLIVDDELQIRKGIKYSINWERRITREDWKWKSIRIYP
ncbi:hypothetical protein I2483_02710 [Sporosarcina sp. E16_3]|nr:hypothetical protein [Sporosarcina sp. E16_3]MBO0600565.1 hypothetical protein [Sporosarcina sp. E16_3]